MESRVENIRLTARVGMRDYADQYMAKAEIERNQLIRAFMLDILDRIDDGLDTVRDMV